MNDDFAKCCLNMLYQLRNVGGSLGCKIPECADNMIAISNCNVF